VRLYNKIVYLDLAPFREKVENRWFRSLGNCWISCKKIW